MNFLIFVDVNPTWEMGSKMNIEMLPERNQNCSGKNLPDTEYIRIFIIE